ncbi:MAG TPA: glycosyltransferase family A protein [Stellaceae bacterium]|nr:glycosyltransferase family A protein [Stellaceae bacterium]
MPRVSYIVTVYNKVPLLPFVVAGLAAQQGDFEREFIFVDDGSSDDSVGVVRRLTSGWGDVTIVEQKNAGPSAAMNVGLRLAKGDFIKPMDGDDLLLPWATRRLIEAIETTGCDAAFSPSAAPYDPADSPEDALASCRPAPGPIERCDDMLRRSLHRAQTNPTCWLARGETVRRSGGCDERVFIQDYSIELRLAAQGAFARVPEGLFRSPREAPGRLSDNQAQTLHDMNLALAHFINERPELPRGLARLGFSRAAARASTWARRRGGKGIGSPEFRLMCGARLRLLPPSPENLRATCAPFAATNRIRIPDGGAIMRR